MNARRLIVVEIAIAILFCLGIGPVQATPSIQLYLQGQSHNWKEYDDNNNQLLKESGPVWGLGYKFQPDPLALSIASDVEGFWGKVKYDGARQNGEPLKDTTEYLGYLADLDLTYPLIISPQRDSSLLIFGGLGVKRWYRYLGQDDPQGGGYTEEWFNFYARLGLSNRCIYNQKTQVYTTVGIKLPFRTDNFVYFDNGSIPDADLQPKAKPAPFIEIGYQGELFFASVFYEYDKYERSDDDTAYFQTHTILNYVPVDIFQPTSVSHIFGINAGVNF